MENCVCLRPKAPQKKQILSEQPFDFSCHAESIQFLIHNSHLTKSMRVPLASYHCLVSTYVTYQMPSHETGHQVFPNLPSIHHFQDFQHLCYLWYTTSPYWSSGTNIVRYFTYAEEFNQKVKNSDPISSHIISSDYVSSHQNYFPKKDTGKNFSLKKYVRFITEKMIFSSYPLVQYLWFCLF